MIQQAKAYSLYFRGGIVYHTNSVELATYYTNIFRKSGLRNFRFVITPATKMGKKMPPHPLAMTSKDGANKLSSAPKSSAEPPRKC